jgi:AcrR family transcriptional regulator
MTTATTRGPYAKGIAKREEILDAALDLFARSGYDRTSVREIARASGLSQAGLLYYYKTKEELFSEVLRRRDARDERTFDDDHFHGVGPGQPVTVKGLVATVRHNVEEPGLVRLFVTMSAESIDEGSPTHAFFAQRYERIVGNVAEDVRRKQEAGTFAPDLDPRAVASLLVAAADGLQIQWLLDPAGTDMGGRLQQLWDGLQRIPV